MGISLKFSARSDIWGSLASSLCLVHCLATPLLFAVHAGHVHGHHTHPFWWGLIDLFFIAISFMAVYWSTKNTSKNWMKWVLWISWTFLAFIILNEKLEWVPLAEALIYIPSIALVVFHLYNRKYCQCGGSECCTPTLKD
ncbi:MerC domain-containing protein [Costertonia aggregata]|uniref:MerC domain-containing protein n=1 Tax=Costertonia aggregata TaxID=343403 RepID=A0A7H9ANA5_9FLAO|nr:MerC domain-containing protein [Costertonia aggregata]QLG44918.1 MerC domain-containing protein [Costertonia aggregata]